ncbi:MAG: helix-turn-helix transcriptional regulator [Cellulosilyticum sp.]|nr:helix-turn-helix transcriptional regulator [Cellulosilyticum sp.]
MKVKIGEKIRELRKKADVNQEYFAEYLGVTAQAVSKWEVEGCYPDIELLPSIASFFNISLDELLCYDVTKNKSRIEQIIKDIGPERHKNWVNGTKIKLLRNAVQDFPNNYDLMFCLAKTLCYSKEPYVSFDEKDRQKNLKEAILICNRILRDCTDDGIRFGALKVLALSYNDMGKNEKAIKIANKLPFARDSRDMILLEILNEEDKSHQIVQNIWQLSNMFETLIQTLANSIYKDNTVKRIELFKKVIRFEELLHEENDFIYENLRLRAFYFWMAEEYMKLDKYKDALECIEKFAKHSILFDALPEKSVYTSVIYNGETGFKSMDFDYKNTTSGAKEILTSRKIFAPIREDAKFIEIIRSLET